MGIGPPFLRGWARPSFPEEGGSRRGEIFGSALLQPADSVCASSECCFH